jgi:RNA polymerase sigma-70 factor, ECF subfamily
MQIFQRHHQSPVATATGFRDMYERKRLPVFRYIFGLTGGPQDLVEDLTADTFLRAWKARHRFEGDMDAATGWLIRIAKRLVIDDYRRTVQATRNLSAEVPTDPSPEQAAISEEQRTFLFSLLTDLPEDQREILVLRYMLGWRVNEVALHLDMTENNVSVTIHRTLSRLREKWTEADPESLSTDEEKCHETNSR